jgi:predicted CoA-binding protein
MRKVAELAEEFLASKRVAVTSVSRSRADHGDHVVYEQLRERDYEMSTANPDADRVEGDPCYHDLKSLPDGADAVVIGTRPETAKATMREGVELGVRYVWMHRTFGPGSVSATAAEYGRQHGVTVIDGGSPLMFPPTPDPGHRMMRWMCAMSGNLPTRA